MKGETSEDTKTDHAYSRLASTSSHGSFDFTIRKPRVIVGLIGIALVVILAFRSRHYEEELRNEWVEPGELDADHRPRLVLMGYAGGEESQWLSRMLNRTQTISRSGKICELGSAPLELDWVKSMGVDFVPMAPESLKSMRRRFYTALVRLDMSSKASLKTGIEGINQILMENKFPSLLHEQCDPASKIFLIRARLGEHFDLSDMSAADSIWFEEFGETLRKNGGKIVVASKFNILDHATARLPSSSSPSSIQELADQVKQQKLLVGRVARRVRVPSLVVHLESLMDAFGYEMLGILRFLEVPVDYNVSLLREGIPGIPTKPLCQRIDDYRGFCEHFSSTEYVGMLSDPCTTQC